MTTEELTTRFEQAVAETEAKAAQLAALQAEFDALATLKTTMEQRVSSVLQSGDPAEYEALAREFITPAEEKARQEKLARIATLRAQADALEAELES